MRQEPDFKSMQGIMDFIEQAKSDLAVSVGILYGIKLICSNVQKESTFKQAFSSLQQFELQSRYRLMQALMTQNKSQSGLFSPTLNSTGVSMMSFRSSANAKPDDIRVLLNNMGTTLYKLFQMADMDSITIGDGHKVSALVSELIKRAHDLLVSTSVAKLTSINKIEPYKKQCAHLLDIAAKATIKLQQLHDKYAKESAYQHQDLEALRANCDQLSRDLDVKSQELQTAKRQNETLMKENQQLQEQVARLYTLRPNRSLGQSQIIDMTVNTTQAQTSVSEIATFKRYTAELVQKKLMSEEQGSILDVVADFVVRFTEKSVQKPVHEFQSGAIYGSEDAGYILRELVLPNFLMAISTGQFVRAFDSVKEQLNHIDCVDKALLDLKHMLCAKVPDEKPPWHRVSEAGVTRYCEVMRKIFSTGVVVTKSRESRDNRANLKFFIKGGVFERESKVACNQPGIADALRSNSTFTNSPKRPAEAEARETGKRVALSSR